MNFRACTIAVALGIVLGACGSDRGRADDGHPPAIRAAAGSDPSRPAPLPLLPAISAAEPAAPPPESAEAAEPEPAAPRTLGQPLVEPAETRAVVLLYHGFDRGTDPLSVRSKNFDAQLQWLLESNVEIIHTSELVEFLKGRRKLPARVAVITIDDGLKSVYERAWPILKRHDVRFTVGLPTGVMEEPKNAPVMTWDQVREMVATGLCEVASHGHMHRRLVGLEGKKRFEELELSWKIIEQRLGLTPVAYFYPLGAYDVRSAKVVEELGYPAAFRASGAPVAIGASSDYWVPRVSVFYDDGPFVGYYFGSRFLGQVQGRPDRVSAR